MRTSLLSNGAFASLVVLVAFSPFATGQPQPLLSSGLAGASPPPISALVFSPCWQADGDQTNRIFGGALANAGDVNGDGFDDIIVGSVWFAGEARAHAFVYHGSRQGLSPTPNWSVEADSDINGNGRNVGTAGDVNGDGYADVIVGSFEGRTSRSGLVTVYYGSKDGLSRTPSWSTGGNQESMRLGYAVATVGDVNGDGYADIIVGSRYGEVVWVFHGSSHGLGPRPDWIATGIEPNYFGSAVSSAGDVNGDGYDDVLVGAQNAGQSSGRVFLYYGSRDGLQQAPGRTAASSRANAYFGWDIGTAGDVNRDGFADIIVGAYGSAEASVYYGSPNGPGNEPDWKIKNDQSISSYGVSVAGAGDVDGDGFADVIVGASEYSTGIQYAGRVYLYRGTSAGLETMPTWIGAGDQFNAHYGGKVSAAGDVNGDGASDFMVSQWGYDTAYADTGRAFVYCGISDREPPVISIVTSDAAAAEKPYFMKWTKPRNHSTTNTATFIVRRTGETNSNQIVFYSIHGTARNGVDYQTLPGWVRIPAGQNTAQIIVWPIYDKAREGIESIVLRLEADPPPGASPRYLLGRPSKAAAFIMDYGFGIPTRKL